MGVGTAGVNITKTGASRAPGFYDTVAAIASDPQLFAQNQSELLRLVAEQEKLIEARAKLDEIDRLKEEAAANLAKARATLHDAVEEAKKRIAAADAEIEQSRKAHKEEMRKDRASIHGQRTKLKERERKVGVKEAEIEPVYDEAKAQYQKAVEAEQAANRMKARYESDTQKIKSLVRELKL